MGASDCGNGDTLFRIAQDAGGEETEYKRGAKQGCFWAGLKACAWNVSGLSNVMLTKATRKYFAAIGRRGGRVSRRTLSSEQARKMVAVRLARSAHRKFRALCFYSYREDLLITVSNAAWVAEQLRRNGNRAAWFAAGRILSLLEPVKAARAGDARKNSKAAV
jgi:hypothetical protein